MCQVQDKNRYYKKRQWTMALWCWVSTHQQHSWPRTSRPAYLCNASYCLYCCCWSKYAYSWYCKMHIYQACMSPLHVQWKALKCQNLGTSLHVIVLMCWLDGLVTLMLAMRILFCFCLCKVRSQISHVLSQASCNLSLALLADFTLSDSTALIRS